tara:strand:+ start:749 stop:1228 length:480 start_codon:yes stop_codon:yes gene_type:complete
MEKNAKIISVSYLRREDFKMPTQIVAPMFPLAINEETGNYESYGTSDLTNVIDQNIKMVLLTSPGERLFDATFGVGLRQYLFENDTTILRGTASKLPPLRENILSQIGTYLPYIKIISLEIDLSGDSNSMSIKLKYFLNESNSAQTYNLTMSDVEEGTP